MYDTGDLAIPASTRVFRVFVSSTFSDMHLERDALRRRVFPRLSELCERHGASFMAVDLRWGVTEAAAQGQQTMRICLEEIARCQRTTPRPNFVALLGNRYGWRPAPVEIPLADYELIRRSLRNAGGPWRERLALLDRWYEEVDQNAIPPVRVLRRRPSSAMAWRQAESKLASLLRQATVELPESRRLRYASSSTEQEITAGALLPGTTIDHAVCFFREIHGLRCDHRAAAKFIDVDSTDRPLTGAPLNEARERLDLLKRKVSRRLREHVFAYETRWHGTGISQRHIPKLVDDAYAALSRLILRELGDRDGRADVVKEERAAHDELAQSRLVLPDGRSAFVGRRLTLAAIARYARAATPRPLALVGPSGVGKTSVMARAARDVRERRPDAVVVQRFIGASPRSTNVRELLLTVGREIVAAYPGARFSTSGDPPALSHALSRLLDIARADRPLIIFLDALDQLRDADPGRGLLWLPQQLPPHVRIIVSMVPGADLDSLMGRPAQPLLHELRAMKTTEGRDLLGRWLAAARRRLRPRQVRSLLGGFRREGLPLYLQLAFEQARTWRSSDRLRIEPTVARLIDGLFNRLSRRSAHGRLLLERSVGYLVCARNGVAEDEMVALLSRDRELLREFVLRSPESPRTPALPPIVWSRLFFDLEPYLRSYAGDGTTLMGLPFREFQERARHRFGSSAVGAAAHRRLAKFFRSQPNRFGDALPMVANRRKLAEIAFQLANSGDRAALRALLLDHTFLEGKIVASGPQSAVDDISLYPGLAAEGKDLARDAKALAQIRDAVRLSAHVLERRPAELAAQLTGRLLTTRYRSVRTFLAKATRSRECDRLRPLRPSLASPGALLRTLLGHRGYVGHVAVTPDGARAASGSNDKDVRVWDLQIGVAIRELLGHRNWIKGVAISPDGQTVVSGALDKTIRIWDLRATDPPVVIRRGARVTALAMFDDGSRFAVAVGNRIEIRALPDGRRLPGSYRTRIGIWSLAVAPRGDRIAAISEDGVLRVWSVAGGELLRVFRAHDFEPSRIVETKDETGTRGFTLAWEVYGKPVFSSDGRIVYAPATDYSVRGRDVETGVETAKLTGHTNTVNAVAVAPDAQRAASAANDDTVRVWEVQSSRWAGTLRGHSDGVQDVAFMRDAETLVSASGDGTLRVWDVRRGPAEAQPDHPRGVVAVAASARRFVSACEWHGTSSIRMWDRNGNPVRRLVSKEWVSALQITPDQRRLVVAGMGLYVADPGGRTVLRYAGGDRGDGHTVSAVAITRNGRYLIDAGYAGARLWDLSTLDLTRHPRLAELQCVGDLDLYSFWLAVSPDNRWVIGSSKEGIRIVPIGRKVPSRVIHEDDRVRSAIVTPDGKSLLGRTEEGACKLWRLSDRKCVRVYDADLGSPLGFTADGKGVISCGEGDIRWWDFSTGGTRATFTGEGPITAAAASPDGSTVIAGEPTGRVHLLRLESARVRRVANSPVPKEASLPDDRGRDD